MYISVEAITEKFAGDFQVEQAHRVDMLDELRGELREVDLIDVHFLFFDEVKQQIERAFEDLELDFIFGHELGDFRTIWRKEKGFVAN